MGRCLSDTCNTLSGFPELQERLDQQGKVLEQERGSAASMQERFECGQAEASSTIRRLEDEVASARNTISGLEESAGQAAEQVSELQKQVGCMAVEAPGSPV